MISIPLSTKIKGLLLFPLLIPSIIVFFVLGKEKKIYSDIVAWSRYRKYIDVQHLYRSFVRLMIIEPEFRTQFYMRTGFLSHFLKHILPGVSACCLPPGICDRIGEGFILMHGIGVVFNGSIKIGKNVTCLHGVTIGASDTGVPSIGDNVYIGCYAQIIGGVTIGNNVKIGAGAIIVDDVPDHCTVVGVKAHHIIKARNER